MMPVQSVEMTARTQIRPPAQSVRPQAQAPVLDRAESYNADAIHLSADSMREVRMSVNATGRSTGFQTQAALDAYLESLRMGRPQSTYDPNGFLSRLGLWGLKGSGRDDAAFRHAFEQARYQEDHTLWGRAIPTHQFFKDRFVHDPAFFGTVQSVVDPAIAAPSNGKAPWAQPFRPAQAAHPTDVPPTVRYANAYVGHPTPDDGRWNSDFHGGVPGVHTHEQEQGYGTYTIALAMGFDRDQARRMGMMDNGVDEETTPYGKTGSGPFSQMDRHFNFNRDGDDTRIIWARRHLEEAIRLGRKGSYQEAEVELGVGLHSLQDLFAHAQITPAVHATLGGFVDSVHYSPVSMVEATIATRNYLRAYLTGIANSNGDYSLPLEPRG